MTGGSTAKGAAKAGDTPPRFDDDFAARLEELLIWRRDVRRFRPDPLPDGVLDELLRLMTLAPSVGNSQPWRLVTVDDPERRSAPGSRSAATSRATSVPCWRSRPRCGPGSRASI